MLSCELGVQLAVAPPLVKWPVSGICPVTTIADPV